MSHKPFHTVWSLRGNELMLEMHVDLSHDEAEKVRAAAQRRRIDPALLLKRLILTDFPKEEIIALRLELGDDLVFYIVETLADQLDRAAVGKA